jgi:hypothetical protein
MKHFDWKHITIALIAVVVACTAALWAWNTLAELFGGPAAEFRHVIAVLTIAAVTRIFVTSRRHPTR